MDFKSHFSIALGIFMFSSFIVPGIDVISAIILAFISTIPDVDIRISQKSHRNIFTHGIIFPIIWLFINTELVSLYFRICVVFAFSLHCFCDIRLEKVGGGYTIKPSVLKMGYVKSTIWLGLNAIIGFVIFVLYINFTVI